MSIDRRTGCAHLTPRTRMDTKTMHAYTRTHARIRTLSLTHTHTHTRAGLQNPIEGGRERHKAYVTCSTGGERVSTPSKHTTNARAHTHARASAKPGENLGRYVRASTLTNRFEMKASS